MKNKSYPTMIKIKCNYVYYPRKSYYIIPTMVFTLFPKYNMFYPSWTIDFRWLRFMVTVAKFTK